MGGTYRNSSVSTGSLHTGLAPQTSLSLRHTNQSYFCSGHSVCGGLREQHAKHQAEKLKEEGMQTHSLPWGSSRAGGSVLALWKDMSKAKNNYSNIILYSNPSISAIQF